MGGVQADLRGGAFLMRLKETGSAEAPLIARLEARKAEFGARGRQVVAEVFRHGEEIFGHDGADGVQAAVHRAGVAAAVAEKSGDGGGRTGGERRAEFMRGAGGQLALFHALPRIGVGLTMLLTQCLAAPFALILEYQALGHSPNGAQMLAALVILIGVGVALVLGNVQLGVVIALAMLFNIVVAGLAGEGP